MKLFPYQEAGVELIVKHYKDVLLADHPGAGKTAQAVVAANRLKAKSILIICPAGLKENWKRELTLWDNKANIVLIYSYEMAVKKAPKLSAYEFDLMICDEAHYLKSAKSKRSKVILGQIWARAKKHILITGTPLPNGRASEGHNIFAKLAPEEFGDWFKYVSTYCVRTITPWGINFDKSKNLEVLGEKCKKLFMIRRKREETIGQLPPLVRSQVPITASNQFDLGDAFDEDEALAAIEEGNIMPFASLRQKIGLQKVEGALDYIQTLLNEEKHIVVFAHHHSVIAQLKTSFMVSKISHVTVTGQSTATEKQKAIDDFQAGKAQVFLGSLLAANVGITLTKSSNVVFVEFDWVPENNTQAEGRCYRIGQTAITRSHYLYIPDSIDDGILSAILRKQKNIQKVLGVTV
jgi:SWI/SNF-related matrix-associated actin-dependent regulator 1 of chromatin subfamily A